MAKRKSAIAAAVMAAAAGGNSVFVLASRKEDLPADDAALGKVLASADLTQFSCTACGTSMHARTGTTPFCITCGAGEDHVHAGEAGAKTPVTAQSDLVFLTCSTCDHSTTVEASVVTAITASGKTPSPIHCSCCGSEMYIKAEAEDGSQPATDLKTPDAPADPGDDFETPAAVASKKLQSGKRVEAEAGEDDDDDVNIEDLDELDEIEANVENFGGKQAPPFKSKSEVDCEASAEADMLTVPDVPGEQDLVLEPFTMEEDTDDLMASEPIAMTEEIVDFDEDSGFPEPEGDPLVDALEMDDTDLALAFVKASGRVVAMKGHIAVASFSKKTAGNNANLINSEALPIAARAAVQADGLRKGLTSVGFKLVQVPVASSAIVARKVQEVKASVIAAKKEEKKNFASIFALAAAGLNRGAWKGCENPLRASVESELARLGVQSPKRVVSAIFEASGMAYAKSLLEVSDRLSRMSASARAEMAEMLEMTNVMASSTEDASDEGETQLEARLTTPALLRPRVTASAQGMNGASAVLAGKSPLSFASV